MRQAFVLLLALLPSTLFADVRGLIKDLKSRDVETRIEAAESLGRMHSADAIAPLAAALTDPNPRVRRAAAGALWDAHDVAKPAMPALRAALTDTELSVVIRAAGALIAMDVPESELEAPLRTVLRGGDTVDRFMAARALIGIEPGDRLVPALVEYAKSATDRDDAESVRRRPPHPRRPRRVEAAARRALDGAINKLQLDSATVVPVLAKIAVSGGERDVHVAALQALRNRGSDTKAAADTIRPLVSDAEPTVQLMAKATLESFGSSFSNRREVATTAAADPEARDRGLGFLRDKCLKFAEDDFYRALGDADVESVTAFLDAGMSPNYRFPRMFGDPALRVAVDQSCEAESKALVKLLLARGADPKLADDRGNTPLMAAARTCGAETIKLLLTAGADMSAKNISGLTAFEFGLTYASDGVAALAAAGYASPRQGEALQPGVQGPAEATRAGEEDDEEVGLHRSFG